MSGRALRHKITSPFLSSVRVNPRSVGSRVKIVKPCNVYDCVIGDDVFLGPFVEVQSGAVLGARTRVQSHAFICSNVFIGEDCFIGHGVTFVNDKLITGPARGDSSKYEHTVLGNNVSIGSNATILPVNIVDGVIVGAGAVVTKDLDTPGVYVGNPAKLMRYLEK